MFWADRIAKQIIDSGKYKQFWVDDMFTPSGFAHVGSLRGPLVHDLIFRALKDRKQKVVSTYIFNDFDPIDGLPSDLQEKFSKYMGFPLRLVPSPVSGFKSFAEYFSGDFKKTLVFLGIGARFLSSFDMYKEGKFNETIKIALNHAELIQDIYQRVSGSKKREKGWYPLQVICEKCGRLGTTRVFAWDGKEVSYKCEKDLVVWVKGCGYTGKVSPFDGRGKLPWKVDWPAHWKVLGVTIEGSGKDHSSAGGSRDIARELCKYIFKYPDPFNLPYEFFLIGGKKMSSSKGLGSKARDLTKMLPVQIVRFLFTRTDYRQTIEFDPVETMAIPDLFDEYDRCWQAYNTGGEENLKRAFELSQIKNPPLKTKNLFIPRFRDIVNYIQLPNVNLENKFSEIKESRLTEFENGILSERIRYAKIWIDNYAPKTFTWQMTEKLPNLIHSLNDLQKKYLAEIIKMLKNDISPEDLQVRLYDKAREIKISPKDAFSAIYMSTIGKYNGPKAAWFLLSYPKEKIIQRLKDVLNSGRKNEVS